MAEIVNPQITDAVTQANVETVGSAPSTALASLFQVASHAVGLSIQNAVNTQQQLNIVSQAVTTQGVALIYSVSRAASAQVAAIAPPAPEIAPIELIRGITSLKSALEGLQQVVSSAPPVEPPPAAAAPDSQETAPAQS